MKTLEEWIAEYIASNSHKNVARLDCALAWHARDAEVDALRAKLDEAREMAEKWNYQAISVHDQIPDDRKRDSRYETLNDCADEVLAVLGDKDGK